MDSCRVALQPSTTLHVAFSDSTRVGFMHGCRLLRLSMSRSATVHVLDSCRVAAFYDSSCRVQLQYSTCVGFMQGCRLLRLSTCWIHYQRFTGTERTSVGPWLSQVCHRVQDGNKSKAPQQQCGEKCAFANAVNKKVAKACAALKCKQRHKVSRSGSVHTQNASQIEDYY